MSNFPDPLVVHVLLLTHEFMYIVICLPHFWYPQCDSPCFSCAQNTQIIPPLQINAVGWSWQMLDCLYSFNGATCRDSKRRIRGKKQHNLQQQYTTYCRLRIKQFKKEKADEMVGLIDARSTKVYCWLRTNGLTLLLSLLSHGLSTFNHILCYHKRAFLTCCLDDPIEPHGISYSVTSYDLDQFLLLTLQFHPALVAGTGTWTLPFNAAMSKHLYTSYPPYILWLPLSRKTFQTWTCSPAQVLIRSLLLSSSTQRK